MMQEGGVFHRLLPVILHTIHSISPLVNITGHRGGKDPVPEKKWDQGEADWEQ